MLQLAMYYRLLLWPITSRDVINDRWPIGFYGIMMKQGGQMVITRRHQVVIKWVTELRTIYIIENDVLKYKKWIDENTSFEPKDFELWIFAEVANANNWKSEPKK